MESAKVVIKPAMMASLAWWTRVWVNSGNRWWKEKPCMLQSMGSQRVGHDWATELNWIALLLFPPKCSSRFQSWETLQALLNKHPAPWTLNIVTHASWNRLSPCLQGQYNLLIFFTVSSSSTEVLNVLYQDLSKTVSTHHLLRPEWVNLIHVHGLNYTMHTLLSCKTTSSSHRFPPIINIHKWNSTGFTGKCFL